MTQRTEPYVDQYLEEGNAFLATSVDLDVADGDTVEYLVSVPSDEEIRYVPTLVTANAGGKLRIKIKKDVTIDSEGSTDDIYVSNRKINDDMPPSKINFETNGTYTEGDVIADEFVQSTGTGTGDNKILGGGNTSTPSFSVYPGHNVLIEITNDSGQDIDIGIRKRFIEKQL